MDDFNNYILLRGTAVGAPEFSHFGRGTSYSVFPVSVTRLSGTPDTLNVVCRTSDAFRAEEGMRLEITGELRSFNNRSGVGQKLVITVFARTIIPSDEQDVNTVLLRGTLCKAPTFRRTPMGREICDLMLAVSRRYGRADYLPVITWGHDAVGAARLSVGDTVTVHGRLQSRSYIKEADGVRTQKTAFEVSAASLGSGEDALNLPR